MCQKFGITQTRRPEAGDCVKHSTMPEPDLNVKYCGFGRGLLQAYYCHGHPIKYIPHCWIMLIYSLV